jgi:AcrR family transcriptional regulator
MSAPTVTARRKRNAADTRIRLLAAAGELFAERGYDQVTVREIGQRADVDAALIARYFGSKAALYLEALRGAEAPVRAETIDLTDVDSVRALLDRVGPSGPTPTLFATVRPHEDAEVQRAAMGFLRGRLTEPVAQRARSAGVEDAALRAEVATAAVAGVVLSRTSGALPELASATSQQVAELVAELLRGLTAP